MSSKVKDINPKVRATIVWLLRLVVGAMFIFSGLAKAIDPWGGIYKITEYFAVMHVDVTRESSLILACLLACFEFCSGVLLLIGAFRRTVVWALSAFMLIMTPLTLWIYISNPVADCGCFGDALILSNGATFAKNVVLCAFIAILLIYNNKVEGVYHYHLQWLVLVASAVYTSVISIIGYFEQPIVDFRPYKVGFDLSQMLSSREEPLFVYEKDGLKKEFDADNLPDDDEWTFVERKQQQSSADELAFFDGEEDVTEHLLEQSEDGGLMLLCVAHPDKYGISRSRMANRLYDDMSKRNGTFAAIISAKNDSIMQSWVNDVEARYDVYTADDTDIKSLVRGDAALVYIKDNIIKWKYNIFALSPEIVTESENKTIDQLVNIQPIENKHLLAKLTVFYLSVLALIWLIAGLPLMLYQRRNAKNKAKVSIDK